MNYRHAFHAGNFADVLKHVVLARILVYLIRKPAPLRYIDTHAGIGWYDLGGNEASRTGEWRDGIGRIDPETMPIEVGALLAPYLGAVGQRDANGRPLSYPGSPALAHDLLRPSDRLFLCERHPEDAAALRAAFKGDKRTKIVIEDGYRSLLSVVPPPERRGLVLIDPPFEEKAEFDALANGFAAAYRKWPTGTYLIWHPVKDQVQVRRFHQHLRSLAIADWMTVILRRDEPPGEPGRLSGSGLVVVNPPYTLLAELDLLLPFLAARLGDTSTPRWHWQAQREA